MVSWRFTGAETVLACEGAFIEGLAGSGLLPGSRPVFSSGRERFPDDIFVRNSSRTVSFIMAPQLGQIERVGAKLRSHTGQFIGFACNDLKPRSEFEKLRDNIRVYFKSSIVKRRKL